MQNAVDSKVDCIMILSYWNKDISYGIHTIFVIKTGSVYTAYNKSSSKTYSSILSLCDSTFIKGYVVN